MLSNYYFFRGKEFIGTLSLNDYESLNFKDFLGHSDNLRMEKAKNIEHRESFCKNHMDRPAVLAECPFKSEMNNDYTQCNCCSECRSNCALET